MGHTEIQGDLTERVDNIQSGTQAQRPTNPKVGDVWIANDTKKFWACFVVNLWVHCKPIDVTGAVDGNYFRYQGSTGFAIPADVSALQYGLDANKPAEPNVGDVYMATDTEIVYYCFQDDIWTPTYLPRTQIFDFEKDGNDDVTPVKLDAIFVDDGSGNLQPTIDGDTDPEFEIVGGEITPKALV